MKNLNRYHINCCYYVNYINLLQSLEFFLFITCRKSVNFRLYNTIKFLYKYGRIAIKKKDYAMYLCNTLLHGSYAYYNIECIIKCT